MAWDIVVSFLDVLCCTSVLLGYRPPAPKRELLVHTYISMLVLRLADAWCRWGEWWSVAFLRIADSSDGEFRT